MTGHRTGRLLTLGHGTSSAEELAQRLHAAGVQLLVDIRTAPGSRRHPHVNRDELARWLPETAIDYRWDKRLGGFRPVPPDSPDIALRNESFRGYAAHMRSPDFLDGVADLVDDVARTTTAVMCSETVWWRCHRRLLADHLTLVRGVAVEHLLPSSVAPHVPTAGVRLRPDGLLVYDDLEAGAVVDVRDGSAAGSRRGASDADQSADDAG